MTAAPTRVRRKDGGEGSSSIATRGNKRGSYATGTPTEYSRASTPLGSIDGSMTSSPSDLSSSSRTPSPITSSRYDSNDEAANRGEGSRNGRSRKRKLDPSFEIDSGPSNSRYSNIEPEETDPTKYGDVILEYFISDTNVVPNLLINPPADFDPNMTIDEDGHTPLHWACAMGRTRVVKLLLTAGADIFKVNKAGQTALMRSVMFANNYDVRKFPELYELLHRSTLNIDHFNRTVFHHVVDVAMGKGKTHAARYYMETLLGRLADFPQELADIINFQDEDGETALTMAARCRSKRLVKLLIDHGADPKIPNRDGKTCEDYILEDERFRSSPVMRSQNMSLRIPSGSSSHVNYPRLHHSTAAQRASGKCTNDMATLLDSLATSFDNELVEKERDLNQAHSLLGNIQAEIAESQRTVQSLKEQASGLGQAKENLAKIEREVLSLMERSYRRGWETWIKEEKAKEAAWSNMNGLTLPTDLDDPIAGGAEPPNNLPTLDAADIASLEELHQTTSVRTTVEIHDACEALRTEILQHRVNREKAFEEFVKYQAEAGTGGRMSEYRRLIGAGCGGIPPTEVDNVVGLLLEVCHLDFVLSNRAHHRHILLDARNRRTDGAFMGFEFQNSDCSHEQCCHLMFFVHVLSP